MRKYNCRRRSESSSISVYSPGGSTSRSNSTSPPLTPPLTQPSLETPHEFAGYHPSHERMKDNQLRLPNLVGHTYEAANMETPRAYTEKCAHHDYHFHLERRLTIPSYDRNTHDIHAWPNSPTSTASPPANFAQVNTVVSGPLYGYQPLSPPASNYSTMAYEAEQQTGCDRRQSYPLMQERQYSTSHGGGSSYFQMRAYGQGHRPATENEPFENMPGQIARHNSTS